ncbi:MAG: translation elongation factor Ts [Pseudobdellovibrio sp.]
MSISATMVKELREKTSAGMMDCKKALEESKGDFEAAVEWLRVKGLSAASKKADRVAAEGLVNATNNGKTGAVVEVNSETDFASRNDKFKELVNTITQHVLTSPSVDTTKTDEMVKAAVATIGENMVFRRSERYTVQGEGLVQTYVHGEGKIGVMIEVGAANATAAGSADAKTFATDICLHIAAMNPMTVSSDQISADVVNKEKEILKAKALEEGKKPEMLDKIVEGQIRKFLAQNSLLDQPFVKNPDMKVSDYMKEAGKKAGGDLTIKRFVRFELGAGIEKKVVDFAAEVAAQTKTH